MSVKHNFSFSLILLKSWFSNYWLNYLLFNQINYTSCLIVVFLFHSFMGPTVISRNPAGSLVCSVLYNILIMGNMNQMINNIISRNPAGSLVYSVLNNILILGNMNQMFNNIISRNPAGSVVALFWIISWSWRTWTRCLLILYPGTRLEVWCALYWIISWSWRTLWTGCFIYYIQEPGWKPGVLCTE